MLSGTSSKTFLLCSPSPEVCNILGSSTTNISAASSTAKGPSCSAALAVSRVALAALALALALALDLALALADFYQVKVTLGTVNGHIY